MLYVAGSHDPARALLRRYGRSATNLADRSAAPSGGVIIHLPESVGGLLSPRWQRRGVRRLAGHRPRRHAVVIEETGRCRLAARLAAAGSTTCSPARRDRLESQPELVHPAREPLRPHRRRTPAAGARHRRGVRVPSRVEVVERLDAEGCCRRSRHLQPSRLRRRGAAVLRSACGSTRRERDVVRRRRAPLRRHPAEDLASRLRSGSTALSAGIAAHHPRPAADVQGGGREELVVRGLVKAVFATETWRWASTCRPRRSSSSGW
jgi:hypothetical protein